MGSIVFSPAVYFAVGALLTIYLTSSLLSALKYRLAISKFPLVNPKWGPAEKKYFTSSGAEILAKGMEMAKGKPFLINDKANPLLIVPPTYIDEVKNDKRLDFRDFISKQFFGTYPGFEGFSPKVDEHIFKDAVTTQLTRALTMTIVPMAAETPNTLNHVYGPAPDWKEAVLSKCLLKSVGRLTALVFLGEKFMNNDDWQRISVQYTVDVFMAARNLNTWPAFLRPFVHWVLPECRKLREEVKVAKSLIQPEVERRVAKFAEEIEKPKTKVLDSVDWFATSAKGRNFDYVGAQLSLSLAAIHTTSTALTYIMCDLVQNPEYIDLLREELKTVWEVEGRKWEKSTLFKLKLLDSVMKEATRRNPMGLVNMPRQATDDITLSDGSKIPKSAYLAMGPVLSTDPAVFPNPEKFDGHRFLNLRNTPSNENKYHFVTTSAETNMFGHGQHACPGRFFASNEIKLLLIHMIMYYDWKLPEGQTKVEHLKNGINLMPNSKQVLLYKSRTPEIDASYGLRALEEAMYGVAK